MRAPQVLMALLLAAGWSGSSHARQLSEAGLLAQQLTDGLELVEEGAANVNPREDQEGQHDGGEHSQDYKSHHHHDPHHTKPKYAFKYAVHDKHTGDVKDVWEHRDGDVTKGGYSVLEPDGHTRIVEYIVTKKGGFQATVKRIPPHHHH